MWPLVHLEKSSKLPHRPPRLGGRRVPYGNRWQRKSSRYGDVRNSWGGVEELVVLGAHSSSKLLKARFEKGRKGGFWILYRKLGKRK